MGKRFANPSAAGSSSSSHLTPSMALPCSPTAAPGPHWTRDSSTSQKETVPGPPTSQCSLCTGTGSRSTIAQKDQTCAVKRTHMTKHPIWPAASSWPYITYQLPSSSIGYNIFSHTVQQISHNKHESLEKDWSRAAIGGRQKFHHSTGRWRRR